MNRYAVRQPTGLCHICGKPTKLLIHQKCGLGKGRGEGKVGFTGDHGTLTAAHHAKHADNQTRKRYKTLQCMKWVPKD